MFAQPFIAQRGIVNTASYVPQGMPGSSIARGSMFSVFGRGLGPPSAAQQPQYPLQIALAGVTAKVSKGATQVDAIPVFVSAAQLNLVLPSNAPLGTCTLQVTYNGSRSNPVPFVVSEASFGAFAANSAGLGPGFVQNFVSASDQPLNSLENSAVPGQVITMWGTGLGAGLGGDRDAPTAGDLPTMVSLAVGRKVARILYKGRSPCCAGLDQLVFEVPADVPLGCWVPVQVNAGGRMSNVVTMAISRDGGSCDEPGNPMGMRLKQGGKLGIVMLARSSMRQDVARASAGEVAGDYAFASFREERGGAFAFHPLISLPPAGTCTAYRMPGDLLNGAPLAGTGAARYLDAGGAYTLSGPRGARALNRPRDQRLGALHLGSSVGGSPLPSTLFLDPGQMSLSASGGADVGRFNVSFDFPRGLTWTNRDGILEVARPAGLDIQWTGGLSTQPTAIIGVAVSLPVNASAVFVCIAPAGATSFQVPPAILANLPAAQGAAYSNKGALFVGAVPHGSAQSFDAAGLDWGGVLRTVFAAKSVVFR